MLNLLVLAYLGCATENDTAAIADGDVACANNVCILSGVILEDYTMTADNQYLLSGGVFIGNDVDPVTLTIEPGTTIYGESATDGMLVIRRNSMIIAEGTADAPIVFTSSKEPGSRARGDWGGLIINGNAPINACGDDSDEFCEAFGEGGAGYYGGTDSNDNSGVLKYVRVEFAGTLISPDNELNGIAFQGVGSGTEVDYIQVHMNADDGVEFFGGSVVAKHVLVTGVGDDSFDWTDGWVGGAQHVILHQNDDSGDQGIEADNNGENNNAEPRSNPTLANFTVIGAADSAASDIGVLLREGTAATLKNFMVVEFNEACLQIDQAASVAQAEDGNLSFSNSVLNCPNANFFVREDDASTENDETDAWTANSTSGQTLEEWFLAQDGNAVGEAAVTNSSTTAPDYTPSSTGSAQATDVSSLMTGFDAAEYIGAVDSEDWTIGWTTHEAN